jgi:stage III sporulation protein AD
MDIARVIIIALIGVLAIVILRSVKPEFAMFAGIAAGVIILLMILEQLTDIFDQFKSISESGSTTGGSSVFSAILKIVGIGYLTEYAASICEDYGSQSISKKVQLAGKVGIFALAIPIFTNIVSSIVSILK